MAIVHIPEEEAIKDFRSVLGRVDDGDEIVIDREQRPVRLALESPQRALTFGEAIEILKKRGNRYSGDPSFADDIEFAMKRMRTVSPKPSPWE